MPEIIKAKITNIRPFDNSWAILTCEQGGNTFRATGTLLHDPASLKGVLWLQRNERGNYHDNATS